MDDISKIFKEVRSDVNGEEIEKKQEKLQVELLLKCTKDKDETEEQERILTLERSFRIAKNNFAKMVEIGQIKNFLDDKFRKCENENTSDFAPYFRYMIGNHFFPAYVVVTQKYKLEMIDQWWQRWLRNGDEFLDAVRVFTALGDSEKLFVEFLLKDWDKKAEYIRRSLNPGYSL